MIARTLAAAVLLVVSVTGCAHNRYTPAKLPSELLAMSVENAQTLDLSRLAVPSTSNELIHSGDVLNLSIAGGLGSDAVTGFPVRVGEDGMANLPEIGPVYLAGLELADAEQAIAAACVTRGLYRQPHVAVTMRKQRINRVTVVGAVEEPGLYELPRGSSYLLAALVAAGGLADDAGTNVEIRQPALPERLAMDESTVRPVSATMEASLRSMRSMRIDLARSVAQGAGSEYLDDNSVVMVERREPSPIHVIGLVKTPGEYEFPVNDDLTVLGVVALAGGVSNALADTVLVIRTRADRPEPAVVELSLRQAKRSAVDNLRLEPGDVVSVERTATTVALDVINIVRFGVGATVF